MPRIDHDQRLARDLLRHRLWPRIFTCRRIGKGCSGCRIEIKNDAVTLILLLRRQNELTRDQRRLREIQNQPRRRRGILGVAIPCHHAAALARPGFRRQPVDRPAHAREVDHHAMRASRQNKDVIFQRDIGLDHDPRRIALAANFD